MTGTGSFGTAATPLAKLFSERVVLDTRTSDPSAPENGAIWFREDLDSGTDKFGEIRWYDGSSTNSIPVFDKGTSASGVEEVLGFKTADGVGYVPTTARTNAAFPQLSFQHGGSGLGIHDAKSARTIVDNFEDNNLSEYQENFDSVSDAATTQSNTVFNGSYALQYDHAGGIDSISSTSGLNNYPNKGDTIRGYLRTPGSSLSNILWLLVFGHDGTVSSGRPNGYAVGFATHKGGDLGILRYDDANRTVLATANTANGLSNQKWYEIEIRWATSGGDVIEADLIDSGSVVASASATDSTYSSTGVGFAAEPNENFTAFADFVQITQ